MEEFEETERSARTDALTGLANRRVFHETLEAEIRRSRRYRWPVTVLLLDLDYFKDVNDSHGHMLGDLVLERVGGIVRHAVRDADAACRCGGEEFGVVLPETAREGGYAVAERIRRRVAQAFKDRSVDGRDIPMTISAGLSSFPEDGLHAEELAARADEALALRGRCVGVVAYPARPAEAHVGIAFDGPIPEHDLMAHVSLSRVGTRGPRGAER